MKENVFDVLMYLFENYMDEGPEFNPDQERLTAELSEAGFARAEIGKAFSWLEGLSELRDQPDSTRADTGTAVRHFTPQEQAKLNTPCRGFLLQMETFGVLTPVTRELVLDRVMALESDEISLDQLKWVMLMVLFNRPGQETAYDLLENIVYDDLEGALH
jgi:Smg protein